MLFIATDGLNILMSIPNKNKTDDPCDDCSDHDKLSEWIKTQKKVDKPDKSK